MTELEEDERERERADRMVRQYRCENLFWRLWGLDMQVAERLAAAVWCDWDPWNLWYHCHPQPIVGFKQENR